MNTIKNRYASEKLKIPLARWKRHVREFLPPDQTAGMQCGYARDLTLEDAFIVYLGGCLLKILKISIPETKGILKEIRPLLWEENLFPLNQYNHPDFFTPNDAMGHIEICPVIEIKKTIIVRNLLSNFLLLIL